MRRRQRKRKANGGNSRSEQEVSAQSSPYDAGSSSNPLYYSQVSNPNRTSNPYEKAELHGNSKPAELPTPEIRGQPEESRDISEAGES
jgi:hypothetical protein